MRVLSFGAGVQTTALAIMVAQGKVKADAVVFADTGGERPETYTYMDAYVAPMLKEVNIPFFKVRNELASCQPDLYGWLWKHGQIPAIQGPRLCSIKFKRETIGRHLATSYIALIGFSTDEAHRAKPLETNEYPLLQLGMSVGDCQLLIREYGWPIPIKSSCWFCPFQSSYEWQWLKDKHRDLFDKALALEAKYHARKPQLRDHFGLYRGLPLWRMAEGVQPELGLTLENSCWSGTCGH